MMHEQLMASQGLLQGMIQQQAALQWQWGEREKALLAQVHEKEKKVKKLEKKLADLKHPSEKELRLEAEASLKSSQIQALMARVSQLSDYITYIEGAVPEEYRNIFTADRTVPVRAGSKATDERTTDQEHKHSADGTSSRRYIKQRGDTDTSSSAGHVSEPGQNGAARGGRKPSSKEKKNAKISSLEEALALSIKALIAAGCCADFKELLSFPGMRNAATYLRNTESISITRFLKNYPAIFRVMPSKFIIFARPYRTQEGLTMDADKWEKAQKAKAALDKELASRPQRPSKQTVRKSAKDCGGPPPSPASAEELSPGGEAPDSAPARDSFPASSDEFVFEF